MASGPSQRRSLNRVSTNLNLVPIMNLFIVIIPILITMWAAVKLSMLQVDFTKSGGGSKSQQEETASTKDNMPIISVGIFPDYFELKTDQSKETKKIPLLSDENGIDVFDYAALDEEIVKLKEEYPEQSYIEIYPNGQVNYDVLINTMDICKFNGFANVGYLTAKTYLYKTK